MKHLPVRQVIFGLEDSLVSTLGVVVGIAAGTKDRNTVILSAVVVIIVEALSMTAGTYLSDKSEMEVLHVSKLHLVRQALNNSFYMGVFYILGGFISVLPFFFFDPLSAILPSVILSVTALFLIGYIKGIIAGTNRLKSGLEMSAISLSAALLGYLIGNYAAPYISK